MTTIEKVMIGMIVLSLIAITLMVSRCNSVVEEAGGMRNIIVETGKDWKEMKKEMKE